jgi:hypothetical protein
MTRIQTASLALYTTALLSACSRDTMSPPDAGLGSRLRAWTPDTAAVLASTQISPLWSATQIVVDDSLTWRALWQSIYAGNSAPPAMPLVDFTSHSVLVYGLGALFASLRFDSLTYYDLGNVAYLTDTRPGSNCIVAGVVLAPIVAVQVPERVAVRKWYLRDVVQQCS